MRIQKTIQIQRPKPVMVVPGSPIDVWEKRIREIEAPTLEEYSFKPAANDLSSWRGAIGGVPMTVIFPPLFPAVPFQIRLERLPPGFPHVIDGNQLCVERLIDEGRWDPTISTEQIFLNMENHDAFRGRS
jgi:hypothetical protein